jgi:hypothetical protein
MYDIFSNNFKIEKGTKIGKETKKDKKLYALKPKPKKSEPQNRGISKGGHPYVRYGNEKSSSSEKERIHHPQPKGTRQSSTPGAGETACGGILPCQHTAGTAGIQL